MHLLSLFYNIRVFGGYGGFFTKKPPLSSSSTLGRKVSGTGVLSIQTATRKGEPMASLIEAKSPVLSKGVHYVTSNFGKRTYMNGGVWVSDFHYGIDLVGKGIACDDVVAIADGTVTAVLNNVTGTYPSQGNYVSIDHGNGVVTVYYHLKVGTVRVNPGEWVSKGSILGYMGATGNVTGAHLHFGVKVGGSWTDPMPYLLGERAVVKKREFIGGYLDRVNGSRGTNEMVMYFGIDSSGTNKWGAEVAIDERDVVLSDPVWGVGDMKIPEGGRVLSGHGLAADWILKNISAGDLVWFHDSMTNIVKGVHRTVSFNSPRTKNSLIVYDKDKSTYTNPYGREVAVNCSGIAVSAPVYGKGDMPIPTGGFVLSGHGTESEWMRDHIKKGSKISVNKKSRYITVE